MKLIQSIPWIALTTITITLAIYTKRSNLHAQAAEEVDFPPKLDADDISYFFANNDMDGLHWALSNVFARSIRNPNEDQIVFKDVDASIVARGGGSTYTSAYKMKVDIEQIDYLLGQLLKKEDEEKDEEKDEKEKDEEKDERRKKKNLTMKEIEQQRTFLKQVKAIYQKVHGRIPPLENLSRTKGLYAFTNKDYEDGISTIYNKALHHTNFDELKDTNGNTLPLLSPSFNPAKIGKEWYDPKTPPVVVIDDVLSKEALSRIKQLLLESTVFYETKMPLEFGGYVGAYIDDGLHDRILLQLAFELNQALPSIMKDHPLQYLWAYKYDSEYNGIKTHADQAAVNVNLWLTDDDANLDKDSGGLVVYTAKPPDDWDFVRYNKDTERVRKEVLEPTNYANVTVPYRENRAVIFDSMLFHHTDKFRFKEGYENRRINLTILYGTIQTAKNDGNLQNEL